MTGRTSVPAALRPGRHRPPVTRPSAACGPFRGGASGRCGRLGLHTRAEPVGPGALALLGLIGALQRELLEVWAGPRGGRAAERAAKAGGGEKDTRRPGAHSPRTAVAHTPSTPVHNPRSGRRAAPPELSSAICALSPEPVPRGASRASGPLLCLPPPGPRGSSVRPRFIRPLRQEEALPRARVRRRSPTRLAAHPDEMRRAVGDSTWHIWLEPLTALSLQAGTLVVEAPDNIRPWVDGRFARVLRPASRRCSATASRSSSSRPASDRPNGRRRTATRTGRSRRPSPRRPAPAMLQPALHVRPVRDRRRQPSRARRRAIRRRDARARLQPAVHLRAARARQDAPPPLDRQLRDRPPRRDLGRLHHRRGVHGPLRRRPAHERDRGLQGRATATWTSCSSTTSSSSQSKARTEEEFFHTFNALQGAGAQLVLTSDRMPRDMGALEERLRERFEAGLVTDIGRPDASTRLAGPAQASPAGRDRRRTRRAGAHRRPHRLQPPRARGRADPRRRVRLADRAGRDRRARRRGPRRPLPAAQAATRGPHRPRDPAGDLRGVRRLDRGAPVLQPRGSDRLAAPGRHVPRA